MSPQRLVRSGRHGLGTVLIDNNATLVVRFSHGIEECLSDDLEPVPSPYNAVDRDQWDVPNRVPSIAFRLNRFCR